MQLHTLKGYIQNIYLVQDDAGLLLLDGCSRADIATVCDYIQQQLGLPLTALKLIMVTHMHPDHAGGAHKLRRLTGAAIACHPKARRWYAGVLGRTAHLIDVSLTWWVANRLGKPKRHIWYNPILKPDLLLLDGQALPVMVCPFMTHSSMLQWPSSSSIFSTARSRSGKAPTSFAGQVL